jgi:hypothetical protein
MDGVEIVLQKSAPFNLPLILYLATVKIASERRYIHACQ